eukprot:TRINITY_DN65959_c0_g1_i1.p2 TRINITY_DN65959_c0_g1~~TRINITY_DN65959_c0_g1_i1.p2  ORF type:complete len:148 (+),score=29.29 TRINITY_DN65959_c0_g1_i1:345-788(+)
MPPDGSGTYADPLTQRWSKAVAAYHGYIFVCPQYNWGYPASLKNALDKLYHEWFCKPVIIVSYGGRGGGKCAEQLKQVLQGLKMRVVETMPAFKLKGPDLRDSESMTAAVDMGKLLPRVVENWSTGEEPTAVKQAWAEFCPLLLSKE